MDASGQGIGIVVSPDLLAFETRVKFGNSLDAELGALASAMHLLQYEQNVPTIFYSDCQGVVYNWVTNLSYKSGLVARDKIIDVIRRFIYREGSCWSVQWTEGKRNRIADKLSRGYGPILDYAKELGVDGRFKVYSLSVTPEQFAKLTEGKIHRTVYPVFSENPLLAAIPPRSEPEPKPVPPVKVELKKMPLSVFLPKPVPIPKVETNKPEPKPKVPWLPRSYTSPSAACA